MAYLLSREFLTPLPTIHYNISTCISSFLDSYRCTLLGAAELADLCMNHHFCTLQPKSTFTCTSKSARVLHIACFVKDYSHKACHTEPLTCKTMAVIKKMLLCFGRSPLTKCFNLKALQAQDN